MIHKCLSNGCTFDDETDNVFIVCPVCGYDMDGGEERLKDAEAAAKAEEEAEAAAKAEEEAEAAAKASVESIPGTAI
jgi:uncharacterized Zn finger protein (UPF0148 family)